jgi:hypothetical protein
VWRYRLLLSKTFFLSSPKDDSLFDLIQDILVEGMLPRYLKCDSMGSEESEMENGGVSGGGSDDH